MLPSGLLRLLHFDLGSLARGVTDPGVGSGDWLGLFGGGINRETAIPAKPPGRLKASPTSRMLLPPTSKTRTTTPTHLPLPLLNYRCGTRPSNCRPRRQLATFSSDLRTASASTQLSPTFEMSHAGNGRDSCFLRGYFDSFIPTSAP